MAAQYRPYRDEDSVDGMETTSWTDNEPGTLQIYEKTTEELPFNAANKKAFWIQIALFFLTGLLGFFLGYFGPFHPSDLAPNTRGGVGQFSSLDHNDLYEDTTIKNKLLAQIDSNNILFVLKKYENTNRIPGSRSDHEFAQYIYNSFHEFGLDPISMTNYTFKIMLPRQASVVRLLNKENRTIYSNLEHDNYPFDDMRPFLPLSQASEQIITTDQILYLNKGLKEDYSRLPSLGLSANETEGKILVIRQSFYQAHDVVITAQESGARAVLFFPDPETFGSQSPFPKSVQLPEDAARSHPLAWSNYGDLAALNFTSLNGMDAAKIGLEKDSNVHIPVLLISFKTAEKILRGLSGSLAPRDWNCFDFTLYVGPSYREDNNEDQRSKIRVEYYNQVSQLTTSTVTGVIAGAVEPDRYIVVGSRRDSLNRGMLDSVSGAATMLEIARVYGSLLKQGWRPRRTIVFNSFGSESLNLIGSSNWLETHQRLLHSRAVAYINCDLLVTGNRTATIAASPLLYQVLYNATKQVMDPNMSMEGTHLRTVYDVWKDTHSVNRSDSAAITASDQELNKILEEHKDTAQGDPKSSDGLENDPDEESLGHHSDFLREYKKSASVKSRPKVRRLDLHSIYSPFLLYAGIPVADVRYSGFEYQGKPLVNHADILEDTLPLIGTKYDNFAALVQIDPHLRIHVAVAQVLSEMIRDLSDSVFLPFNLLDYAVTLRDSYAHFAANYGKTFKESNLDLGKLLCYLIYSDVEFSSYKSN